MELKETLSHATCMYAPHFKNIHAHSEFQLIFPAMRKKSETTGYAFFYF